MGRRRLRPNSRSFHHPIDEKMAAPWAAKFSEVKW